MENLSLQLIKEKKERLMFSKERSEVINNVYRTYDLNIFNHIIGNRPPNPQHVKRLAHSIKTNGMLQNPIIVNDNMQVIDGQHRLMAAKEAGSCIYYIVGKNYKINEVQILNLNQKNWSSKDFMYGYAKMGIESYIKLNNFHNKNKCFNITDCISLCSNIQSNNYSNAKKFDERRHKVNNQKEVFQEGTWVGKDFELAQNWADKIKIVKSYYDGYNKSIFVKTMIGLLRNDNFDFFEFINKLKLQQDKMIDSSNINQCRLLIEDIYNHRRREKVNLRY